MKNSSRLKIAAVLCLNLTLTACANNQAQLQSAHDLGVYTTAINMKDQPPDCGKKVEHAPIFVGEEARIALSNERRQTDKANDRGFACWVFNKAQIDGVRIATAVTLGKPVK